MRIFGIILARGGSKRIPRKNIKELNGYPLIYYSIKALMESKVDEVWVSTDDSKIANVANGFGASILNRPPSLAKDDSPSEEALLHFANHVNFDVLVFVQPTSPMITGKQIDEGLSIFINGGYDSLFSAVKTNGLLIWKDNELGEILPTNYDPENRGMEQTRKESFIYIETGGFYITTKNQLLQSQCRLGGKIGICEIPYWTSFEVDTFEDFMNIERLMVSKHEKEE